MRDRGGRQLPPVFNMNWGNAKKGKKYILIPIYFVYYIISYITKIGCIWKAIFKIPCPGCGYTRAILSMLRLDIEKAWNYHPMFWASFLIAAYFIFEGEVFRNKFINSVIGWMIILGFLVVWILRLSNGIIV